MSTKKIHRIEITWNVDGYVEQYHTTSVSEQQAKRIFSTLKLMLIGEGHNTENGNA